MADLKVTIFDSRDERLPSLYLDELKNKIIDKFEKKEPFSNIRIISSDNVTGKDYNKRYGFIEVSTDDTNKAKLKIHEISPKASQRKRKS